MKQKLLTIACLLLAAVLLFSGCNDEKKASKTNQTSSLGNATESEIDFSALE